ncbi:MAG: DUF1223 domain-containing protein [Pseudomonadota bacterium]
MRFLVGLACLIGVSAAAQATDADRAKPVVELFTSQGCSSCPPADKHLGRLAQRDDVIALSFNVDYWDYLGWRDTLAKPEFTARQRSYAVARGDGQVYTPQMIVNGRDHMVGGDDRALKRALRRVRASDAVTPTIGITPVGKLARVTIGDVPAWSGQATVWVATLEKTVTTKIKRGENRGRSITYHNVVRDMTPVGVWTGGELVLQLDPAMLMTKGTEKCVLMIQAGRTGRILTAAWL